MTEKSREQFDRSTHTSATQHTKTFAYRHQRFLHCDTFIRIFTVITCFAVFAKGDIPRPSDVSACISYNATGFPHLNIQLKDSGIDGVTSVKIYYSVNGRDETNLTVPYQGSNNITDIMLPDVQYNDNISIQVSLQSATTMTGRSDPLILRANPLYSVESVFIGDVLTFNCKLACRTSIIKGCEVSLLKETEITSKSKQIVGALERISGRDSTVLFLEISLNKSVSYRATALTDTEFGVEFVGRVDVQSTLGISTIMPSQTTVVPTGTNIVSYTIGSSIITDTATSSVTMLSSIVANTATPSVSSPVSNGSSGGNMITIFIVIGVVVAVVVVAIIVVILVIIVRKVRNNKHNDAEWLKEKSLKVDEATLPALVRARMVSIKSEASNVPSYEQVDDIQPTKLLRKMQPSLELHYDTHEFKPIANTHISYLPSTNNHQLSDYNRLVYDKGEEDSTTPPLPNKQNYDQLHLQTHNYDEVYLGDETAEEPERIQNDYTDIVSNESSSS